jgi:hypothetical protein
MDTFYIIIAPQATSGRPVSLNVIESWHNDTLGFYISKSGNTYQDYVRIIQDIAGAGTFNSSGSVEVKSVSRSGILSDYGSNTQNLLMDEIRFMVFRSTIDIMLGGHRAYQAYVDLMHTIEIYSDLSSISSSILFDSQMPEHDFPAIVSALGPFVRSDFYQFSLRRESALSASKMTFDSVADFSGRKFDASGQTYYLFKNDCSHQPFSQNVLTTLSSMSV